MPALFSNPSREQLASLRSKNYERIPCSDNYEVIQLIVLSCLLLLFLAIFYPKVSPLAVVVAALGYSGILVAGCYRQICYMKAMIWSCLVWFRLGSAVFIGFGAVIPYIIGEKSQKYLRSIYDFTNFDILELLTVATLSTLIVIFIARFFSVRRPAPDPNAVFTDASAKTMIAVALLLLCIGFTARYLVVFQPLYGLSGVEYHGWVVAASKAYAAGLFLLLLWTLRHARRWLIVPIILIIVDATIGLLLFDKSEIVLLLAFSYLAFLYSKFSLSRAISGIGAIVVIIYFSQPLVHYGRQQIAEGLEVSQGGTIAHRASIVVDYLTTRDQVEAAPSQGALIRFSAVVPGTWVMNRFDSGLPGDAHEHAFAALVPRVVWPDKPAIGNAGAEAYYLLRGRTGVSFGVGHFAEAYWSFGWLGVPLVFVPSGIILATMTVRSVGLIITGRWLQLPVVLLSLQAGYKVEGSWIVDVVGPFAMFIVLTSLISILEIIASNVTSARRKLFVCFRV